MIALFAAAAATVTLPFTPPVGTPVVYETEQTRLAAGEQQRFRRVDRLLFARDGAGWRLDLTMTEATAQARPDLAALFDYGMRPFAEVTVSMRLSPRGEPMAVLNGEAAWNQVTGRLGRLLSELRARNGGETGIVKSVQGWFDRYAALTGEERDAQLMQSARELVGYALPPLAVGATTGTTTLAAADATKADYALTTELPGPGGTQITATRFTMDRRTGMLLTSRTETRLGATLVATEEVRQVR